jgi:hypothetical protein
MALEKVGYDGVWMLEIGAPQGAGDVEPLLEKAASARARLDKLGEPIEF